VDQTILIVDDSRAYAAELRGTLEQQGYHVLNALRAEEAYDMLRTDRVDLIIAEAILGGADNFDFVRRIRQTPDWQDLPVIMLSVRAGPDDYMLGFESGVNEYFAKPIENAKLLAVIRGLIARAESARQGRALAAASQMHMRAGKGEIVTVFSLKGGVGTSTIAVNLAVAFKKLMPSARIGLIDLSVEEGLDALMLDIVPTSTLLDWAREDVGSATPYLLNQYFVPHPSGISLLAAPPSPEDAEIVRPEVVRRTLELAREAFDYIVVDTASSFTETSLIALESAQSIVLPVSPDMASLKTTVASVRILKAVRISEDKFRFVLNEILPRAGLTREQVEGSVRHPVRVIPHAGPAFIEASNSGMPLTSIVPPPAPGRAIMDLAATMCEPEVVDVPQGKQAPVEGLRDVVGRIGRLRRT